MRPTNVVEALVSAGHTVTLWSADFDHQRKLHRYGGHTRIQATPQVDIRLVSSRGYDRNIGIDRLLDHAELAYELFRRLDSAEAPDVAFVGFPPIEFSAAALRWLQGRGVPSIVDVKDQWPEVLLRALPGAVKPLGRLALRPYFGLARRSLGSATAVSSISEAFLEWALEFAGRQRSERDFVLPLTTPRLAVAAEDLRHAEEWWERHGVRDDRVFTVSYVGSINSGLALGPVLDAARQLGFRLIIAGDGPALERLKRQTARMQNVILPGWVDRPKMAALARLSSVAIAPYISEEGFALGIPNKAYDAMAQGLPLVTSIVGATQAMVEAEGSGVVYGESPLPGLVSVLRRLMSNPDELAIMAARAARAYDSKYSFDVVYGDLVRRMEALAAGL